MTERLHGLIVGVLMALAALPAMSAKGRPTEQTARSGL
jgi:hypothetical protein